MQIRKFLQCSAVIVVAATSIAPTAAQQYKTDIPPAITIPDSVETRLGTLRFTDGFPDDATVEKVYDNLDFQHGVQAFLTAMPAASLAAMRKGVRGFGPDNQTVTIFESLMDSRSLFLTANTESIYAIAWLDLKNGPVVDRESAQHARPGRRLLVSLRHRPRQRRARQGQGRQVPVPAAGLHAARRPRAITSSSRGRSATSFGTRGFQVNGDPKPGVDSIKQQLRIYPLADAAKPPATNFVNVSGQGVQHHPCDGLLVLRGSERGHPGGAGRRDRSRNAGAAGLHRHREGHTVRARRADEEDPRRGRGGRPGDGPRARLSVPH